MSEGMSPIPEELNQLHSEGLDINAELDAVREAFASDEYASLSQDEQKELFDRYQQISLQIRSVSIDPGIDSTSLDETRDRFASLAPEQQQAMMEAYMRRLDRPSE